MPPPTWLSPGGASPGDSQPRDHLSAWIGNLAGGQGEQRIGRCWSAPTLRPTPQPPCVTPYSSAGSSAGLTEQRPAGSPTCATWPTWLPELLREQRTENPPIASPTFSRYNLLDSLKPGPAGGRLRRRPRVGTDTTVTGEPASPLPHRGVPTRGESDPQDSGLAATLRVVAAPTSYADSYLCAVHAAGRAARSSGVAGHGLVQFAEGLLDAGVEVVRTLGAVLACRRWFGRLLGQPCPGLVGDRAGLVALGAVKAIVEVWRRGVGHGDCPGSRSGRAVRPAPRSGEVRGAGLSSCTLRLLPGRVDLPVT
jgi:hypothetical protein